MDIDKYKALYVKPIVDYKRKVTDPFGDFEFYLRISKCYTLSGLVWRVEVPNYTGHDKNLWRLLERSFQYVHDKGMRYCRLEDTLISKGIWRNL